MSAVRKSTRERRSTTKTTAKQSPKTTAKQSPPTPAPPTPAPPPPAAAAPAATPPDAAAETTSSSPWPCSSCTLKNTAKARKCRVCNAPRVRPTEVKKQQQPAKKENPVEIRQQAKKKEKPVVTAPKSVTAPPKSRAPPLTPAAAAAVVVAPLTAGDQQAWSCVSCTYVNTRVRKCAVCHAAKPVKPFKPKNRPLKRQLPCSASSSDSVTTTPRGPLTRKTRSATRSFGHVLQDNSERSMAADDEAVLDVALASANGPREVYLVVATRDTLRLVSVDSGVPAYLLRQHMEGVERVVICSAGFSLVVGVIDESKRLSLWRWEKGGLELVCVSPQIGLPGVGHVSILRSPGFFEVLWASSKRSSNEHTLTCSRLSVPMVKQGEVPSFRLAALAPTRRRHPRALDFAVQGRDWTVAVVTSSSEDDEIEDDELFFVCAWHRNEVVFVGRRSASSSLGCFVPVDAALPFFANGVDDTRWETLLCALAENDADLQRPLRFTAVCLEDARPQMIHCCRTATTASSKEQRCLLRAADHLLVTTDQGPTVTVHDLRLRASQTFTDDGDDRAYPAAFCATQDGTLAGLRVVVGEKKNLLRVRLYELTTDRSPPSDILIHLPSLLQQPPPTAAT